MAERLPLPSIPQGAVPRSRSRTSAGTIYTVPAGRRLHVAAVWVTIAPDTASGSVSITGSAVIGESGTVTMIALAAVANLGPVALMVPVGDLPMVAGATVVLAVSGLGGAPTFAAGFVGWEEGAPAGSDL